MINILPYLEDADLMRQLHNKSDKYLFGLTYAADYGLRTRLQDGFLLAKTFGYDCEIVAGILFGIAYSWPPYGEQGAAVLQELDPDYSRTRYAQILIRKLLAGIETDATEVICTGIQQVLKGGLRGTVSPELMVAYIIDSFYNQADRLPTLGERNMLSIEYMKETLKRSKAEGDIVRLVFPEDYFDQFELREVIAFDPEQARTYMTRFYRHYLTHFDEIPDAFKKGFEQASPELVTACYLSTRNKYSIENMVEKLELR